MLDTIAEKLISAVLSGGATGVIALLAVVALAEAWMIKRLLGELAKKDQRVFRIIEDYHAGQMTMSEALNSLKNVLMEIRNKL